jgi:16S rRNA (uracil1498-N3)-methyltransferase
LITERGGVKHDAERSEKRLQHWKRVLISACEQCGRNRIPTLNEPVKLTNWLATVSESARFVLDPQSSASFRDYAKPDQATVILVGAEGGLSAEEVELAKQLKFKAISLGPRVLRTETAAVTAISLLQYLAGDL